MHRIDYLDVIETDDERSQSGTNRAQGQAVILASMGRDQQYPLVIKIDSAEPFVVKTSRERN